LAGGYIRSFGLPCLYTRSCSRVAGYRGGSKENYTDKNQNGTSDHYQYQSHELLPRIREAPNISYDRLFLPKR